MRRCSTGHRLLPLLVTACCHCSLMCCYRCLSTSSSHLTPPHVHVHLSGETKAATHATIASASRCCHCRACAQVLKHSSIHCPLHPLQRVFPFVHPCRRPATTLHRSAHQCVKWKYASSHPTSLQQAGRISTFPRQLWTVPTLPLRQNPPPRWALCSLLPWKAAIGRGTPL
jgi:hypothetical protein